MSQRHDPARSILAIRAQHDAWRDMAGEPIHMERGVGKQPGHPTLPEPCRCPNPVGDDGTCILCGKGTL